MREILFRGKRKDSSEWVEGRLLAADVIVPSGQEFILEANCIYGCDKPIIGYEVDEETVGQFTGLTDKNGKKIFEGDIVRAQGFARVMLKHWGMKDDAAYLQNKPEYELYKIKFNEGKFQLFTFRNESGAILNWGQNGDANTLEVIGNIHDNHELLKVQN